MESNLIERYEFDTDALVSRFPSEFEHPNKDVVYAVANPPDATHSGTLNYTRWRGISLPTEFELRPSADVVVVQPDFYDYEPFLPAEQAKQWHVNFADPVLFAVYHSGFFAQDEMQVAEHPALGSLADALSATDLPRVTVEDGMPTPVLISGVERRCRIATEPNRLKQRPDGLYGYRFSEASPETVMMATTTVEPPTITNLIAMAAPNGGSGRYSAADIAYVLSTAFTSFQAAGEESGSGVKTVVHSGFWGCGAFGGNRLMMTMLQAIAASMAGIDHLVLHAADETGAATVQESLEMLERQVASPGTVTTSELMRQILGLALEWGRSDGN